MYSKGGRIVELIFVRHGQGEHTLKLPDSLQLSNPSLTKLGRSQAKILKDTIPLTPADILIVSPTLRTLQTAYIWSEGIECSQMVHPSVGPRIFPHRTDAKTLACDVILDQKTIQNDFPAFSYPSGLSSHIGLIGINLLPQDDFDLLADEFISYCRSFKRNRVFIVTHDGTITSYRQKYTDLQLTREDFFLETESITLVVDP